MIPVIVECFSGFAVRAEPPPRQPSTPPDVPAHWWAALERDPSASEHHATGQDHTPPANVPAEDDRGGIYPITIDAVPISPAWTTKGNQVSAYFGSSVATAGDVNGDGFSDVVVGAPAFDNGQANEGRAYVYHGSAAGLSATHNWTAESNQAGASFGISVATAGDVNGDGYSDMIVGASDYDNGQTDEGRTFVYHGSAAGLSTTANWIAESNLGAARFGFSVATAGDVNGDGFSDVIVGAYRYSNGQINEGRAFVYHGSAAGLSASPEWTAESHQADAYFGYSVSTAGDVNGDGYSDVIVGAHLYDNSQPDEGRVFVYHGSAAGLSASPDWTAESDQAVATFGYSVATAGDVNGDGYSDVIVGADRYDNGESNEGRAFVYHGSAAGLSATAHWTAESDQAEAHFGFSVTPAGDVNGDGFSDVMIGAPLYDGGQTDEGRVWGYYGSALGLSIDRLWVLEIDAPSTQFGSSVFTAGDIDGDGFADLVGGAPQFSNSLTGEGGAFAYSGGPDLPHVVADWSVEIDQEGARFGYRVNIVGDVNGDGYADAMVGGPWYDNPEPDEGIAALYLGSPGGLPPSPQWTAEVNVPYAAFGYAVESAGDVNGDGYGDVVIGARHYSNGEVSEGGAFVYLGSLSGLSLTPAWQIEGNQPYAWLGRSTATAGDVNGDGYSDVLVGAYGYSNPEQNEGRVYLYPGGPAGLSLTPSWIIESNQPYARLGSRVCTAGDVNGDGFSDILVCARQYSNPHRLEGAAFVFHGGRAGPALAADWSVFGGQAEANLGWWASTAGDVNGDGYSDVIVSAWLFDNGETDEGQVYVYHGGPQGLSASPAWTSESNQAFASYGSWVSGAGDVNGDGYSDALVGAYRYDEIYSNEGAAFLYLGGPAGLSPDPAWVAYGGRANALFGVSTTNGGDLNGDGFADILIGAWTYSNGETDEGAAFAYYGNGGGLPLQPQQRRADDTAPIAHLGRSHSANSFRLAALGRAPLGRGKVALEWEVKPLRTLLDSTGLQLSAAWTDTGVAGAALNELSTDLPENTAYHWRMRLLYDTPTSPFQQHSRWISAHGNGWNETDLRILLLAGDLDSDGDVDLGDYAPFAGCLAGPGVPVGEGCTGADLNANGSVDLLDFAEFQRALGT